MRDQKYQKSKRGRQLLSRRRRHTRCAYVSIPLFISFCRLATTRANILPRQSDCRLNRKYGSDPRLTQTLVCSSQHCSFPNSMSIKSCSLWWSLVYSGKRIKSHGENHPPRRICSLFAAYFVCTRGMADDMMRDRQKLFDLLYIAHTCRALLFAANSTGCEVVCKGGRGAFL